MSKQALNSILQGPSSNQKKTFEHPKSQSEQDNDQYSFGEDDEIIQFSQPEGQDGIMREQNLYALKQGNDNLKNNQTSWTQQENIKYLAFLTLHADDFRRYQKVMITQMAEYVNGGNFKRVWNRYFKTKALYKQKNLSEIIQIMRQKLKITTQEVQAEIINLKAKEEQQRMTPEPSQFLRSKLNDFLINYQSHELPYNTIKVLFGEKIECKNVQYRIVPNVDSSTDQKRFIIFFSFNTEKKKESSLQCKENPQNQRSIIKPSESQLSMLKPENQRQQQRQISLLNQKSKEQNTSSKQCSNQRYDNISDYVKLEISNHINQHEILSRIDESFKPLNFRQEILEKDPVKYWRYAQKLKFLTFIIAFQQALQNHDSEVFRMMQEFIQTKTYQQCYGKFMELKTQNQNSIKNLISKQFEKYNFDKKMIFEKVRSLRQYLVQKPRIFRYENKGRIRTFETSKELDLKIKPQNIENYIRGYMQQINIMIKRQR